MNRTIRLPYPHLGQQIVRKQAKRFNYLAAGRRWRKTTLFVTIALELIVMSRRILWGAPTHDQVMIPWDECKYAAAGVLQFTKTPHPEITLPGTEGRILFRSLDNPDNARGHTVDDVIIDECAEVKAEAWHEVLRPILATTKGSAWLGGTPQGREWFFKEHRDALSLHTDDSMAWQIPTLGAIIVDGKLIRKPHPLENPEFDWDEMLRLFQSMPELSFRQEMLAEFIEGSGSIFRNVDARAIAQRQNYPISGHRYIIASDWGKMKDWTVLGVGDLNLKHLVHMERFNQIDYRFQMQRLVDLCTLFNPIEIYVPSDAKVIVEGLEMAGVPIQVYTETNASNKEAVESLSLAFDRDPDFAIIDDEVLKSELKAYTARRMASGLLHYTAPDNEHDDTVSMLRMLWQGMRGRQSFSAIETVKVQPTRTDRLPVIHSTPRAIDMRFR